MTKGFKKKAEILKTVFVCFFFFFLFKKPMILWKVIQDGFPVGS